MTAPTLPEPRPDDEGRETAPSLAQIIDTLTEVQWSVAFDCLHHETLTPHGRWVLTHAADVLRALTPHPAETEDTFAMQVELYDVMRRCTQAGGAYLGAHDAAKRLLRMGYRKVAPPALATCSRCRAENVVTAQSVCLDCVGHPSAPDADAIALRAALQAGG